MTERGASGRVFAQLHSSLKGGSFGQGGMEDVLLLALPLDPDPLLDADAPLDP
jgi:hypothetical protein